MNLYTGKGDQGNSSLFDCQSGQRIDKDAPIFEALGRVDELTSYLGLCKLGAQEGGLFLKELAVSEMIEQTQHHLFTVQAEVGGADKHIAGETLKEMERWIDEVSQTIPPIKSFTVPGGSELSVRFDIARTLARRAERYVVAVSKEQPQRIKEGTLAYLNRLSSLFFALARLTNHQFGIKEEAPRYDEA